MRKKQMKQHWLCAHPWGRGWGGEGGGGPGGSYMQVRYIILYVYEYV